MHELSLLTLRLACPCGGTPLTSAVAVATGVRAALWPNRCRQTGYFLTRLYTHPLARVFVVLRTLPGEAAFNSFLTKSEKQSFEDKFALQCSQIVHRSRVKLGRT